MSRRGFRSVVRGLFYFWDGIAHADREAGSVQQGNVWQIVADISNCRIRDASLPNDFLIGRRFQWLLHVDKFHLHFLRAAQQSRTFATSDATGTHAGGVGERQALAVMGIESLNFKRGAVVLRKQGDAAV